MRDPVLTPAELSEALNGLEGTGWAHQENQLVRTTKCQGFAGALAYVNAVGALAEAADHHPDIDIRWDTVTLRLSTHSAGGLTEKDLALAAQVDALG
jgi:4a-hydroxytetrahydrobiopterin dehydratase